MTRAEREVCVVTVAGRHWSSPLLAFVRAVRQYPWPTAGEPDQAVECDGLADAAE
jgi:hypothetical protein